MNQISKELFSGNFSNPFRQALAVLAISLITMIVGTLFYKTGVLGLKPDFAWLTSAAYILLFVIFNCVITIASDDIEKYLKYSLFSFGIVLFISAGLAYLFSGIPIGEAGSYKWIYAVLFIAYIALLSIGGIIKRIAMILAEEEEQMQQTRKGNPQ